MVAGPLEVKWCRWTQPVASGIDLTPPPTQQLVLLRTNSVVGHNPPPSALSLPSLPLPHHCAAEVFATAAVVAIFVAISAITVIVQLPSR